MRQEIPRELVWVIIAVLTVCVLVLIRGVEYRADNSLAGSWDIQVVMGDMLAYACGWASLGMAVIILGWCRYKRLAPEALYLTIGSIVMYMKWGRELAQQLPSLHFYFWLVPAALGICVLFELAREKRSA